ncbi:hypothetical protein [Shewanella sp. NIFS-20-20]|uniref:hypothetical protein n=1 Tax=Shewanella sp. NIFS-20-20 TaxID=2853806 RepID=UPI001C469915|nr:hypothetical protein [Shewanella sp. NIFS-20-20]MBV7314411.1 hypothetical protein [Shewanella sp. NIFS-20-20]
MMASIHSLSGYPLAPTSMIRQAVAPATATEIAGATTAVVAPSSSLAPTSALTPATSLSLNQLNTFASSEALSKMPVSSPVPIRSYLLTQHQEARENIRSLVGIDVYA